MHGRGAQLRTVGTMSPWRTRTSLRGTGQGQGLECHTVPATVSPGAQLSIDQTEREDGRLGEVHAVCPGRDSNPDPPTPAAGPRRRSAMYYCNIIMYE